MDGSHQYLIEVFLPLADNRGNTFPELAYEKVEQALLEFGGVTTYPRSPASGKWRKSHTAQEDDLVVYEIMADDVDGDWWRQYRQSLEREFRQERILIRSHTVRIL